MLVCDALDAVAAAGDEGDARAACDKLAHEREAQARRAAGDGDSSALTGMSNGGIHERSP